MTAFLNNFNPGKGDLLYGMAKSRASYLEQWEISYPGVLKKYGLITVVDDYNTLFYDIENSPGKGGFTPHEILNYFTSQKPAHRLRTDSPNQIDVVNAYSDEIFKHKFSPQRVHSVGKTNPEKISAEGFTQHSVLPTNLGGDGIKTWKDDHYQVHALNLSFKAIRRACKFGVGFIADNLCKCRPDAKICFLLDKIRMPSAFDPELRVKGWLGNANFPITYSELRYTYRNWPKFKARVVFYMNYEVVAPPWEEDWVKEDCFGGEQKAMKTKWLEFGKQVAEKHKGDGKYTEEEELFLLNSLRSAGK